MRSSSNIALVGNASDKTNTLNQPSGFSLKKLEQAGLEDLVPHALEALPYSEEQASRLLLLPLPLLGALANLQPRSEVRARLRPLIFSPVQKSLAENRTLPEIASEIRTAIHHARSFFGPYTPLSLAVDDWHSGDFSSLLEVLTELSHEDLNILGPSTSEIKLIAHRVYSVSDPEVSVPTDIFEQLSKAGIKNIEGGGDLRVHLAAAERGFQLTYTHNLVRTRLLSSSTPGKGASSTQYHTDSFLSEIYALRKALLPNKGVDTWALWSSWLLDSSIPQPDAPLGLEVLRALLLARLLLPEIKWIRAPLSLVGMRLGEIAAEFGISDFGFVAVDAESAKRLGLLTWSLVSSEFQASHDLEGAQFSALTPQPPYENG